MTFRLLSTKFYISFYFIATVSLFLLTDRSGVALATAVSITLHEAAHLIAMWACGCAPDEISLVPGGIKVKGGRLVTHKAQLLISVSGPVVNLLTALLFLLIYSCINSEIWLLWIYVSFFLGVINLLPAKGLDGGTALTSIIQMKFSEKCADTILSFTSMVTILSITSAFIYGIIYSSFNITFLLFAIYLAAAYFLKF